MSTIIIPLFIELIKYHSWGFCIFNLFKYVHFTHLFDMCIGVSIERDLQLVERA